MPLSDDKIKMVARVFALAPGDALHRLELVLGRARTADPTLEPVHALAAAESRRRRMVAEVFEPLTPMTDKVALPRRALLSRRRLDEAWRVLAEADPDLAEQAGAAINRVRRDEAPAPVLDEACLRAADLVGESDPTLAGLLRLSPVLRRVQRRLGDWTRNLSGENVAAMRLAFKDALEISEEAGPVFWEAVFAMLDEPWHVIRLISAAIDRPSDRYLADSELAGLCERLLDDIDERVAALKRFDPERGEVGGVGEAASVLVATQMIAEFEEWLALNRQGPWGQRIGEQKKALSLTMEARLREIEPAVAAALPTQPARGAGKSVRPVPKLAADPHPLLVNRAEALLALMEEARGAAAAGGFASLRAKTIETMEKRLDPYCDDLIEVLRGGQNDEPERVRAYLEIAARFTGMIRGPQSAQLVRRRAAAA